MTFLSKILLENYYLSGLSMADIAKQQHTSLHKVSYWMRKYQISSRNRSEATYLKKMPLEIHLY